SWPARRCKSPAATSDMHTASKSRTCAFGLVTASHRIDSESTTPPRAGERGEHRERSKNGAGRWTDQAWDAGTFSIAGYFSALLTANAGLYRVIVFMVTPDGFVQTDTIVSREEATAWVSGGRTTLAPEIGTIRYSAQYTCTVLIYEFEQKTGQATQLRLPGHSLTAQTHLTKTRLLSLLAKQQ